MTEYKDWRFYRRPKMPTQPDAPPDPIERVPADHPLAQLPPPPSWRRFDLPDRDQRRAQAFRPTDELIDVVNMALYLRRPLLITGKPGTGKSTLAWSIAHQLKLDRLLKWPITTRSTLQDGLYIYDAMRRLEDVQIYRAFYQHGGQHDDPAVLQRKLDTESDIGQYIRLGPLGTAMLGNMKNPALPRVLLIDEIDKSDIDLSNDLLNVLEEGQFEIREIRRFSARRVRRAAIQGLQYPVDIQNIDITETPDDPMQVLNDDGIDVSIPADGRVCSKVYPIIIMTSNGERDFPPAFLRRCLRYDMPSPESEELKEIVASHLRIDLTQPQEELITNFANSTKEGANLATDQLLNLLYLLAREITVNSDVVSTVEQLLTSDEERRMKQVILRELKTES